MPMGVIAMVSKSQKAERYQIDQFGPIPTMRQQLLTLVTCGAVMLFISGTLDYLGLI
jgi:hypothetical protein